MLLSCAQDAAEVQKEYLQYGIRLPTGVPLKVFYNRLMQINSYFVLLPCLKDTTLAPEDMPRANKELSNFELTTVILRAVPTAWVNSYKLTHPVIPMDSKKLREDLEVIEKSESCTRRLRSCSSRHPSGRRCSGPQGTLQQTPGSSRSRRRPC